MGVAGNDLEESVVVRDEGFVVDTPCVHLPESEFGALRHETNRAFGIVVKLVFHLVADGRAVNDDRSPFDGLFGLVLRGVAQLLEGRTTVVVDGEDGATTDQVGNLCLLGDERGPLVEGDFVDTEVPLVVGKQADERFTDGPGAHHVNDFHEFPPKEISKDMS